MSKSRYLLNEHTVTELFTIVYVVLDDYLKVAQRIGYIELPASEQQKGSYAELMTIALVGDLLNQADVGLWFRLVKSEYQGLFPVLPDESRSYRILRNLERVWADFALCLTANHEVIAYAVENPCLFVSLNAINEAELWQRLQLGLVPKVLFMVSNFML